MAAGVTFKHKRKAGAFSNGELAAGEFGVDTTNGFLYVSFDGTTVVVIEGKALINTQTASYTLALADKGKIVEMNVATANNLTVPPNSTIAFPIGTIINLCQMGAGQTTVVAGAGVTIRVRATYTLKLSGQYGQASLYKRGTDEWVLTGDLEAV